MAKPRIFISSTYYDLKHIRSSLENFIDSLGFEAILSEKGNIAYTPEIPLDESCYREVTNADIFIIIVGGRYGTENSGSKNDSPKEFYDRYESITKKEYFSAVERDIPAYILIERTVYSDFETFLKNKSNKSIDYAHVDSINIFYLIEEILTQPKNNPVQQFDRFIDIENWLKEQWAGLFRDLLNQRTRQTQIASLASEVSSLTEVNETLKRYLEVIMPKIVPESKDLISIESTRLKNLEQDKIIANTNLYSFVSGYGISLDDLKNLLITTDSLNDFFKKIGKKADSGFNEELPEWLCEDWITDINEARKKIDLDPFIIDLYSNYHLIRNKGIQ